MRWTEQIDKAIADAILQAGTARFMAEHGAARRREEKALRDLREAAEATGWRT